ncbi:hypothetical protein QYE76_036462 [Lolium multiflorum]|uniref:SBP-type domain-containing protein n=1 Tax=Lolium multiflorum TaxID=4521 RepID=A0AAD8R3M3_LOLMU|nr:hypothetical protein QYE76_036462 [Lolium multiflorum]
MLSGRMNSAASDDYQFAAMQQQQQPPQPYLGFDHAAMVSANAGGGQRGHQGTMMYDNFDFAAAAAAFGQFQQDAAPHHHHQMLAQPPPNVPGGGLMAPPPMPHGMQLQMPPMPMAMHGGDLYPALGMVKREGGGGGADAGRIGLNLGRRTYFSPGDMMAVDRMLMRSRLGGVFGLGFGGAHHQPPRCQAEGCKADLSGAKHYHRRHKVCEYHAKASLVAAGGKQQRFCQQCSRFHVLTEFDEAKRSCRKRLAEHNRRRRKPAASSNTAAGSKDSAPPSKKPNAGGAMSGSYTADNNNMSAAKSTISSNTSAISCLQQDQNKVARPTALTLGALPAVKDDYQLNAMHLQAQADHHHRHQEQQHFITSLLHSNNTNNNILSCSSVCSSGLPSAAAANGEDSDQNNNDGGGNNNNGNNMHLFEVDFM